MNAEQFSIALGKVNDKYIMEAVTYERKKKRGWLKWGAVAACLCFIVAGAFIMPHLLTGPDQPGVDIPGPNQRPISAYIPEDVSAATVRYSLDGEKADLVVEGPDLDELRNWANNLKYTLTGDSGKEIPEGIETGETFEVILDEGDYPGFTYIAVGDNVGYLLIEGYWFQVTNPSTPPVGYIQSELDQPGAEPPIGHGPVQRPISAYIQEDVSAATVRYSLDGEKAELVVEGTDLDELRNWANSLKYTLTGDSGKEIPEGIEAGEAFEVILDEGDYPGFTYIAVGDNVGYLLIEGYWYQVTNPSVPPITQ